MTDIASRLAQVREQMAEAALRAGRRPSDVSLVAVSKTFPIDAVREAYAAGQRLFGENKVQELLQKAETGRDMADIEWHLIGHLQSNKARKAASAAHVIHVVDSVDLLQRIDRAAGEAGRQVQVLLQVDLALEATKFGAPVDEVPSLVQAARACTAAHLCGLMLIPPAVDDPEHARPWFRQLRELRDRLLDEGMPPDLLRHLSMGMSHDFSVAIEEGATLVRVGSAIFGARSYAVSAGTGDSPVSG